MITLSFPRDLYVGVAVDAAAKVYADHATIELEQTPEAYVLRVVALGEANEELIADELANYALGASVEHHGE